METIKIQHLFGRFFIFFLLLIVVVFAEEYSINRLCLNINGFPFIFMNGKYVIIRICQQLYFSDTLFS